MPHLLGNGHEPVVKQLEIHRVQPLAARMGCVLVLSRVGQPDHAPFSDTGPKPRLDDDRPRRLHDDGWTGVNLARAPAYGILVNPADQDPADRISIDPMYLAQMRYHP